MSAMNRTVTYHHCRVHGCEKTYRFVELFYPGSPSELHLEEIIDEEHNHYGEDVVLRGLSNSQKEVVLRCQDRKVSQPKWIVDEFNYLNVERIAVNEIAIEVPTTAMITSFMSYLRRQQRGGVAVGTTTLQDIEAYANASAYTIRLWKRILSTNRNYFYPLTSAWSGPRQSQPVWFRFWRDQVDFVLFNTLLNYQVVGHDVQQSAFGDWWNTQTYLRRLPSDSYGTIGWRYFWSRVEIRCRRLV